MNVMSNRENNRFICKDCEFLRGCYAAEPNIKGTGCAINLILSNEPWIAEMVKARADNRIFIVPDLPQDMDNLLEPLKLQAALQSQIMKITALKELRPKDLSILDYTILAALKSLLEQADSTLKVN